MYADLAKTKILRDYHAVLYRLTGVATDFVSVSGECFALCPPEHCNRLCRLIRGRPAGQAACTRSDRSHMDDCRSTRRSVVYRCHAGLTDIIVPLFLDDRCIGFLSSGQVLRKKPTLRGYKSFCRKMSAIMPPDAALREAYFRTPVLGGRQIEALTELLSLIGNYVVESESRFRFLESIEENGAIQTARDFIERHYQNSLSVADIAGAVHLSVSHFSHLFKKQTGTSPIQYLNRVRIGKAVDLVRNTQQSITRIALDTGFANPTHFNRTFRALTGQSPSACRKKQNR